MIKILVVCLGNICRSPAGEGILRAKCDGAELVEGEDYLVESAGTGPWHVGRGPDPRSLEVCLRHGIDISAHRGRQVEVSDGKYYDLILGMDNENIENLKSIIPEKYHEKIHLFAPEPIEDPYYGDDGFGIMFEQISAASDKWVTIIQEGGNQ